MDKKTILHTVFSRILRTLQIEGGTRESTKYIVGQEALSTALLNWLKRQRKSTVHSISAQTSQQAIKCSKGKE